MSHQPYLSTVCNLNQLIHIAFGLSLLETDLHSKPFFVGDSLTLKQYILHLGCLCWRQSYTQNHFLLETVLHSKPF
jgi:hypothetical protein